jgi:hypothetical protein
MKTLPEYIHLYIGCELRAPHPQDLGITKGYLTGIHGEYGPEVQFIVDGNSEEEPDYPGIENIKLVLRKLTSILDEESVEAAEVLGGASHLSRDSQIHQVKELMRTIYHKQTNIPGYRWMELTRYLLSKGFDIFNLIDENLAIDAATFKPRI